MIIKYRYYFLLRLNSWAIVARLNSFNLILSILILFKFGNSNLMFFNITALIITSFIWWLLYRGEHNTEGTNSFNLEQGLKFSILLFISSEVFFFFSFFWSYFHYFLSPTLEVGIIWPPNHLNAFDYINVPLINTIILLTSGVTVTMSHHYLTESKFGLSNKLLLLTLVLGLIFTSLQVIEYKTSFFVIRDSTFGTSFFVLTGFHGLHVLIGTLFLAVTLWRNFYSASSKKEYLRFELASWYWHFVDVVWIFLYFLLYYLND